MSRPLAAALSLAVLAAVLYPATWSRDHDSFPLSNYPMFARRRASAVLDAVYAIGLTAGGERRYLSPRWVGNGEVLQARATYDRADARGRRGREALCAEIAEHLATAAALPEVVRLELIRGRHDAVRFYEGGTLGTETRLARCDVPGRPGR